MPKRPKPGVYNGAFSWPTAAAFSPIRECSIEICNVSDYPGVIDRRQHLPQAAIAVEPWA
jgi:hypothetical protein